MSEFLKDYERCGCVSQCNTLFSGNTLAKSINFQELMMSLFKLHNLSLLDSPLTIQCIAPPTPHWQRWGFDLNKLAPDQGDLIIICFGGRGN
jgi:hypothetical protein